MRVRFRTGVREKLFGANDTLGLKVIKLITPEAGRQLVKQRKACVREDGNGGVLGYQLLKGVVEEIPREARPSCTAFSRGELDAIAGAAFSGGRSETLGLSDEDRAARVMAKLPAVDFVELALEKYGCYQLVH